LLEVMDIDAAMCLKGTGKYWQTCWRVCIGIGVCHGWCHTRFGAVWYWLWGPGGCHCVLSAVGKLYDWVSEKTIACHHSPQSLITQPQHGVNIISGFVVHRTCISCKCAYWLLINRTIVNIV
jgi:hypothetical protein